MREMLSPKGFARVWYINFRVQDTMLVMLEEPADISPQHVCEHSFLDRSSHVFRHLQSSESCQALSSLDCFKILDSVAT